jgi:hypothetical protein
MIFFFLLACIAIWGATNYSHPRASKVFLMLAMVALAILTWQYPL